MYISLLSLSVVYSMRCNFSDKTVHDTASVMYRLLTDRDQELTLEARSGDTTVLRELRKSVCL